MWALVDSHGGQSGLLAATHCIDAGLAHVVALKTTLHYAITPRP
jgi:hypothetical protein